MPLTPTLTGSLLSLALALFVSCGSDRLSAETSEERNEPDSTRVIFENVLDVVNTNGWQELPTGQLVQNVSRQFLGRPYKAGLLDVSEDEELVLELSTFDCVLLVENVLAISFAALEPNPTFDVYANQVERLRYRNATRDGYCSRLHYFTDWIADNEQKGLVVNITEKIGGETLNVERRFMSEHRDSYVRLAESDSLFQGILQMEEDLAGQVLYFVPQDSIRSVYPQLRAGDIVATSTSVAGLDVSHTGFVYHHGDGNFGFLHASTSDGVTIADDLHDYVNSIPIQTGIVVARPVSK